MCEKTCNKHADSLLEINDNAPIFGEQKYFFTVMGRPSAKEPWGWQLDGHHLNFFVLGDQVVMTPLLLDGAFRIPPFATTRFMAWLQDTFGITYAQLNDFFDAFHYGIVGPYVFWVLILAHAGAAIHHHVVQKDDVLVRMLPRRR